MATLYLPGHFLPRMTFPFLGFTNIVYSLMINEETKHNKGIVCVLNGSFYLSL